MRALRLRLFLPLAVLGVVAATTGAVATTAPPAAAWRLSEYTIGQPQMDALRTHFVNHLLRTHKHGTWAPMKMTLNDRDLKLMGLPPKRVLLGHRFAQPTMVTPDGHMEAVALPS